MAEMKKLLGPDDFNVPNFGISYTIRGSQFRKSDENDEQLFVCSYSNVNEGNTDISTFSFCNEERSDTESNYDELKLPSEKVFHKNNEVEILDLQNWLDNSSDNENESALEGECSSHFNENLLDKSVLSNSHLFCNLGSFCDLKTKLFSTDKQLIPPENFQNISSLNLVEIKEQPLIPDATGVVQILEDIKSNVVPLSSALNQNSIGHITNSQAISPEYLSLPLKSNCDQKETSLKCTDNQTNDSDHADSQQLHKGLMPKFSCTLNLHDDFYEKLYLDSKKSDGCFSFRNIPFPPIGVFWDIENCSIPRGLSVAHIVQAIRNKFFDGYKEAEFVCVCNTLKTNPKILEELNETQVSVLHVASYVKNAADDKLLHCLRRFADIHGAGSAIVVISGDSDFATELYDIRYRKRLYVILVHNAHAPDRLKLSAHETALFSEVIQEIPLRSRNNSKTSDNQQVLVWNIPSDVNPFLIKKRLLTLSGNCYGKNIFLFKDYAKMWFHTPDQAAKACRRLEGSDVFGFKIKCCFTSSSSTGSCERFPYLPNISGQQNSLLPNFQTVQCSRMDQFRNVHHGLWGGGNYSFNSNPNTATVNQYSCSPAWGFIPSAPQTIPGVVDNFAPNTHGGYTHVINDNRPIDQQINFNRQCLGDQASSGRQRECISKVNSAYHRNNGNSRGYDSPVRTPSGSLSHPQLAKSTDSKSSPSQGPIELLITNLDQDFEVGEMKKTLLNLFSECVMVLHISVYLHFDGSLYASVTVQSLADAQFAISQFHRRRIGKKKINLSRITREHQPPELKRSKVFSLLREIPDKRLPLFKFRELYERRYQEKIALSEIFSMKDIISVSDNLNGRTVSLNLGVESLESFVNSWYDPDELRYCQKHFRGHDVSLGWAEIELLSVLPRVNLSLKEVSTGILKLLDSHSGRLPLLSVVDCYCSEVNILTEDKTGVSLEHLISCVPEVNIVTEAGGFKVIQKCKQIHTSITDSVSPPLLSNVTLFSREVIDLLKTFPRCELSVSKFIYSYNRHFGRQCRVANYGHTKLLDLLASLPHLVQIMGEGSRLSLTLTHRTQVRRFTCDLLRVVKSQLSKVLSVDKFPGAFERVFGKKWDVTDYGVCNIQDILNEIKQTVIVLNETSEGAIISIPKARQTPEEIERTRLFANEVVQLLRHSPECRMKFSRFVPAYHHHYNRQCFLSDYGFTKLIELFEVIPDVVQVIDDGDGSEKTLQLVESERIRILDDQIFALVKNSPLQAIKTSALASAFKSYYGYSLNTTQFSCEDIDRLLEKLNRCTKVVNEGISEVRLKDHSSLDAVWTKVREVLWEESACFLAFQHLVEKVEEKYNTRPNLDELNQLNEFLEVREVNDILEVRLLPLQIFLRDLLIMLNEAGGRIMLANFESLYLDRFGSAFLPSKYGYSNLVAVLQQLPEWICIKGQGRHHRLITLDMKEAPKAPSYSPPSPNSSSGDTEAENSQETCASDLQYSNYGREIPSTPPFHGGWAGKEFFETPPSMVGLASPPSTLHPPYHYSSTPPFYPPSPIASSNVPVMWGQIWPPQYSVMSPVPHASYMVLPPNPCELPSPTMLTNADLTGSLINQGSNRDAHIQ